MAERAFGGGRPALVAYPAARLVEVAESSRPCRNYLEYLDFWAMLKIFIWTG